MAIMRFIKQIQALPLPFDSQTYTAYNQDAFKGEIMEFAGIVVIAVLILIALAFLVGLLVTIAAARRETSSQASAIVLLHQQLEALKASQDKTGENLTKSLQQGQTNLNQNLQSSQKVLSLLNTQIGELHGTNKQMLRMGTDVRRLQDILSSPKLRGQMGEWSLENLLAQILPADSYELQYTFKDGKIVDALVKLVDFNVPVDAKFPLPAFEAILKAETDEEKTRLRKQFLNDVIKHIDKIASNYIRPAEQTLDFALMYIPAENIYYETIVKFENDTKDILSYALEKKVIPVSPNLLYAYLMTVVMGLHGLQIEKQAAQIRQNLQKLNADFAEFVSNWDTLGSHIRNTSNKYDEAGKKLDRFGLQLEQIQTEGDDRIE